MPEKESENKEGGKESSVEKIFPDIPDDFYERLGVAQNASTEEINSAWKKKIGGFRPDKYTDEKQKEGAEEWSKNLNEARQTLGDDEKRKKYDEKRNREQEGKKKEEEEETRGKEKTQKEDEERATTAREEAMAAYPTASEEQGDNKTEPDKTVYNLSSAKRDKIGLFVFVDGYKVYVNDGLSKKDKNGKVVGAPTGSPVNPFWRDQVGLLSPSQKFFEQAPQKAAGARETVKNFTRSLLGLNENPKKERKIMERYEAMVRDGKAEFVRELAAVKEAPINHAQKNIPDMRLYKIMKKTYNKKGSFDNYEFKLIGVYDEKGYFTGKTRLYRIKKEA